MTPEQLRSLQAPLKAKYKEDPAAAHYAIAVTGTLATDDVSCVVHSPRGSIVAGLHPATGGDGSQACSADMLLEALVACAGVTLKAVATALGIPLANATVTATGELDFRGTLGVARDASVGLSAVRLVFAIQSPATAEQIAKLIELTERYCVIYQTLKSSPKLSTEVVINART
ncbi:MAG: OsmC family protein [Planctomycetota bacterium]